LIRGRAGAATSVLGHAARLAVVVLALGCVVEHERPPESDAGAAPASAGGHGGAPAGHGGDGGVSAAAAGGAPSPPPPDANVPDAAAAPGPSGGAGGSLAAAAGGSGGQTDLGDACTKYCACMSGGKCKARLPADCMSACTTAGPTWALACRLEKCMTAQHDYQDQVTGDCLAAIGVNACFDE
jgi:hypothetical protein